MSGPSALLLAALRTSVIAFAKRALLGARERIGNSSALLLDDPQANPALGEMVCSSHRASWSWTT